MSAKRLLNWLCSNVLKYWCINNTDSYPNQCRRHCAESSSRDTSMETSKKGSLSLLGPMLR